ncbi:curli production assembly/transport component CsgG [Vreelandella andesensis]|uniref:Curli production assembly/transport component CsgG n=1 Tax=Vreelandella andesensis TaxID=447567 RepID=A0A433KUE9_9GAMM|nr:CsgG/HfaB family protein [Halomonas andesensis]RUR33319.1 curli production assembly/transport component CsgG [Halomonas andesensis]
MKIYKYSFACCLVNIISGCASIEPNVNTVQPLIGPPVTSNHTPYSQCLADLRDSYEANNLPVIAVGQISDKTGQKTYSTVTESSALTQGVSEMLISAFYKTGKVNLTERLDVRIPLAEQQLFEQNALAYAPKPIAVMPANFVILGALTELNYNISTGGARLFVSGIGGGIRTAVINVGLDLRLVDVRTFRTLYVSSLQKQVVGYEVESGVYRFFGNQLIEFDTGAVRNEPLQLGVRSVVEMSAFQILTEGLGLPLPEGKSCEPEAGYPVVANHEVNHNET